jgi:hypothetical protein
MLRFRFGRSRPAVTHACRACESRRAMFRILGVATWDRYRTLCVRCHRRAGQPQAVMGDLPNP